MDKQRDPLDDLFEWLDPKIEAAGIWLTIFGVIFICCAAAFL